MKAPEKAPEVEETAPISEEPKKAAPAPAQKLEANAEPPASREALDALVKEQGVDVAMAVLKKVKVVDLRSLAREYNGEFGIAGREIRNANKTILIDEFRKFFTK